MSRVIKTNLISVIVPVYNESQRIHHLEQIIKYLKTLPQKTELIVVDDGSKDDTLKKLRSMNSGNNFRILTYKKNAGKGYAIKTGMLAAKGDYCLFLDVDLSTPISEMGKFIPVLGKADIVIGTRKSKGANVVTPQPIIRKWMGRGFTLLSQIMLNVWVSDFTCGFKFFSKEAAKKIFSNVKVFRWGFDSEVLFLAKKYGFSVKEVPVTWVNDLSTKVKFPRDIIVSFRELLTIRNNDMIKKVYE
jgi:dolichyl-phosphate beta-glucosyltransferase